MPKKEFLVPEFRLSDGPSRGKVSSAVSAGGETVVESGVSQVSPSWDSSSSLPPTSNWSSGGTSGGAKASHRTWKKRQKKRSGRKTVHRTAQVITLDFIECENLGQGQPRRCDSCKSCKQCSVRSQAMTKREADELHLIENAIVIDPVAKRSWFKYPFIKNPQVLQNNRSQVIVSRHLSSSLSSKRASSRYTTR